MARHPFYIVGFSVGSKCLLSQVHAGLEVLSVAFFSRKRLQESYQNVLKLLMELVKATIAVEDLICSKIGLCLDDSLTSGDSTEIPSIMEETRFMQYFRAKEKHHLEKGEHLSAEMDVIISHSWKTPFLFIWMRLRKGILLFAIFHMSLSNFICS